MYIDRSVFAFAGIVTLASLALSQAHSAYWLLLTAFVGLNMVQAAFTGFCPVALVLNRRGSNSRTSRLRSSPTVTSCTRRRPIG
jgi:hypothetical protein